MKWQVFKRGTIEGSAVSSKLKNSKRLENGPGDATAIEGGADAPASRAELNDFLAADYLGTQADPEFKERLRKDLWSLVSNRYGPGSSSSGSL